MGKRHLALVLPGRRRPLVGRDDPARTDPVDRCAFEAAIARLGRSERVVGVVVLDLDPLPSINDALGRDAGEEALTQAAAAMHGVIRLKDVLARTGGDGFVALLPGCTAGQAVEVARRIQAAVATIEVDGRGRLSVSVGVAHGTGLDLFDVLRTAEEHLRRGQRRRTDRPSPV